MKKLVLTVALVTLFTLPALPVHAASLTEPQVQAILGLLSAFGVNAATIANVSAILHNQQPSFQSSQQNVQQPTTPSQSSNNQTTGNTSTPPTTPAADIKVNGSDGPVVLTPNSCIVAGVKTCAYVTVSWTSQASIWPGCGITGTHDWSGNFGTSGGKWDNLHGTTTVAIQCATDNGKTTDSVDVVVDLSAARAKLDSLKYQVNSCQPVVADTGNDPGNSCHNAQEQLAALQSILQ